MEDDKIKALAEWLRDNGNEVSEEDITQEDWGSYIVNGNNYKVYTDEEADEAYEESVTNLLDDLGIDLFGDTWFADWVFNNALDIDWFDEALREDAEYLADNFLDESSSTYANRLVEECYDNNLIDDNDFETDENGDPDYERCTVDDWDLKDRYADWYENSEEDSVEWFRMNFGDKELKDTVKERNLLDYDAIIEHMKDTAGRGEELSNYDGVENEYDYNGETYYIYQTV